LLAALGVFLRSHTRGDDIACRYGGEEFALILPDAPHEFACKRGKQLCEEVRNLNIQYHGLDLEISRFPLASQAIRRMANPQAISYESPTPLYTALRAKDAIA